MINLEISKDRIKKVIEVKIKDISEKNFNPRKHGLLEENLKSLIESEYFPEIHLGLINGELIVVDGYHRLEASKRLGLETIRAYITEYSKIEGLQKDAINENINHGQRLSDYDISLCITAQANKLLPLLSSILNILIKSTMLKLDNFPWSIKDL